jgi:hypothetical protein
MTSRILYTYHAKVEYLDQNAKIFAESGPAKHMLKSSRGLLEVLPRHLAGIYETVSSVCRFPGQ